MIEIISWIVLLSIVVGLGYIAVVDFKRYEIPDRTSIVILLFLAIVNIVLFLAYGSNYSFTALSIVFYPFGNLQAAFILGVLSTLIVVISKERAMGQGDIRMLIIAGLLVGTTNFVLFYSVMLSTAICYGLYLGYKAKKLAGIRVPLGTFIVIGIYASLLFSLISL